LIGMVFVIVRAHVNAAVVRIVIELRHSYLLWCRESFISVL
jgi:hypothetical protein